jgi:hypothetical protein
MGIKEMTAIDWSQLTAESELPRRGHDDDAELKELCVRASKFVGGFKWCRRVLRAWLGDGCPGIFAVVLVEVENTASPDDRFLWVVVGDIPPAYFVVDELSTPKDALGMYVAERLRWIQAVRARTSLDDIAPVDVAPTEEHASKLQTRIDFLKREFLDTT